MRRRSKEPTALKVLRGSYKKNPQRRNHAEPVAPEGRPRCPSHLNAVAKCRWKYMCQMLEEMHLQTPANMAALEIYCSSYATWREELNRTAPDRRLTKQCEETMIRILIQFGFTPSARAALYVNDTEKVKQVMRRDRG